MVGIHAKNVSLGMANRNRVDDKPENACEGHREVKGQMSAFWDQKSCLFCTLLFARRYLRLTKSLKDSSPFVIYVTVCYTHHVLGS